MDPERSAGPGVASTPPKEPAPQSRDASADPLFQQRPVEPPAPKRALLLWQFFFFPVLIVVAALGAFLLFGMIGAEEQTPAGLLETLLTGGANKQKQAAQQLAILISNERRRVEVERDAGTTDAEAPFYAASGFRQQLLRAFDLSLKEGSRERQRALARAIGVAQVSGGIPKLLAVLYPESDQEVWPQPLRRAAAAGLLHFESREAQDAYVRMAADEADTQVRVMGVNGLAILGLPQHGGRSGDSPAVEASLVAALGDASGGVRVNAAYALALREDPRAAPHIQQSLTDAGLKALGIPEAMRRQALFNAIRGAAQLGGEGLRTLVAALQEDKDARVAARAKHALEQWAPTKGESSDAE